MKYKLHKVNKHHLSSVTEPNPSSFVSNMSPDTVAHSERISSLEAFLSIQKAAGWTRCDKVLTDKLQASVAHSQQGSHTAVVDFYLILWATTKWPLNFFILLQPMSWKQSEMQKYKHWEYLGQASWVTEKAYSFGIYVKQYFYKALPMCFLNYRGSLSAWANVKSIHSLQAPFI